MLACRRKYLLFTCFHERFVRRVRDLDLDLDLDLRSHKVHPIGGTDLEDD
jgi:hypothetical protein